jgi:hypothetical protein
VPRKRTPASAPPPPPPVVAPVTVKKIVKRSPPTVAKGRWPARLHGCDPDAVGAAYRMAGERWDRLHPSADGAVIIR